VINISEYYCKDNWKTKVYRPNEDDFDKNSPEWISMKVFLLIQQKNKCARCRKKLTVDTITIHHIIPRSEGGTNDIKNIIGLCINCHNLVEPKKLKREDIIKYYKKRKLKKISAKNDWHLWVYGGFSRFLKNKKQIIVEKNEEGREEEIYSYPKNIKLHKKIFKKEPKNTKIFGKTQEELSNLFGVTEQTICNWSKYKIKCEIIKLHIEGKI